jgi:16S rRNA (guanine527-N7)-methyltransferase
MGEGRAGGHKRPPGGDSPGANDLAEDRAQALRLVPVSRETAARLDRFVALLLEWQRKTNLVANSTLPHVWTRHVADSAQLLRLAPDAKIWIDLGSGAGFPGLVIACALAETPGAKVHLVESTGKKCAFLREVVSQLVLPAIVHCDRIEKFAHDFRGQADVVIARALAPLDRLLSLAAPMLKNGTIGLFPKMLEYSSNYRAERDLIAERHPRHPQAGVA